MIDLDKWQEILSSLRKQKLRTGLTAFGVFWGIFMLVILLGFGGGFGYKIKSAFGDAKNFVVLWSSNVTQLPYQGMGKGRHIDLKDADVEAIHKQLADINMVDGRNILGNWGSAQYIVHNKASGSFSVIGSHQGWEPLEFIRVFSGRFVNRLDEADKRKVAVIGTRVQEVLFKKDEDPIGKSINIQGVNFMVVGIYRSTEPGDNGENSNTQIYIPNTTLRRAFNQTEAVNFILFTPRPGVSSMLVEKQVKQLLNERHKVNPEDVGVFGSFNMEDIYHQNMNLVGGIVGFSWLVAIGTIIAGVIGVGNIMLVVVKERTREIGLRKAMGATPLNISLMIMQESLALTLVAGYAGLVAGVLLLEAIKLLLAKIGVGESMFASPFIDIGTALMALLVLVVTGALASLLPAIKAASVSPISALQDE